MTILEMATALDKLLYKTSTVCNKEEQAELKQQVDGIIKRLAEGPELKETIRKRNLLIKQLRNKKYPSVWDCIHDNFEYHRLDAASHQAITHHAQIIQDLLAE